MKKNLLQIAFITYTAISYSQCTPAAGNIYAFTTNGINYEIIKENLIWADAAACAVNRGGILSEINSQTEQDSIFKYVNLAGIVAANTDAPDGGGASYLWIGGTDRAVEGDWMWDGNNDGTSVQFWQGTSTGTAVGGLYNNWGNEPDDFSGQDALGFAYTNWPYGVAGEWNDIDETNSLYFIIEYPNTSSIGENKTSPFSVFPNPSSGQFQIQVTGNLPFDATLFSIDGKAVWSGKQMVSGTVIPASFETGIYYLTIWSDGKKETIQLVIE